jgi:hypothetical protein
VAALPADQLAVAYESARPKLRAVEICLYAFVAASSATMVGDLLALVSPGDLIGPAGTNSSLLRLSYDILYGLGFLAEAAAFVTGAVFFLLWFHRVYRNLPALGVPRTHSTKWPVYVWFIPIANIWLVPRTVQETWDGSHGRLVKPKKGSWATTRLDPGVRLWWAAFFGANVVGRIAPIHGSNDTTAGVVSDSLWLLAINALLITSAVLLMRLTSAIQTAQDATATSRGFTPAAVPEPVRRCSTCGQVVGPTDAQCRSCLSPL